MSRKKRRLKTTEAAARRFATWMQQITEDQAAQAEALPLRRDMVTLLTYLHENRITGTRNTGNLPLKAVREVTAGFVNPPKLETTTGDRTYRIRSEDDVWPLQFLHTLAYVGGLLEGGPAQRWLLTPDGASFLVASPSAQVWALLTFWWERSDWLMAYPFEGMGEGLPLRFTEITLDHLLALPTSTRVPFEPFADRLIQATKLKWTAANPTYARMSLHGAVRNMVIRIMADFEVVEREYQERPLGKGTNRELVAFQVTPFGKRLLESLK